jgi:hypothetical protein
MDFYRRYSLLLGLLVLVLVIVLLLSTPTLMFSPGVTFIDSELYRSSGNEAYVRTKMDFGNIEQVNAFPHEFGVWRGYDYDTAPLKESLGADIILLRGYECPGLYQPIFFLLMQAKNESSFHPPQVCYPAMGYKIEEEGKELVHVEAESWEEPDSLPGITIPMVRLLVYRESEGRVTERRVALFCYVKGNRFTSDAITMIRMEALAPVQGSYDSILGMEKAFIASAIPHIFEPSRENEWKPVALQLIELGIGGYLAIAFMVFIPLAIIIYSIIRWRKGSAAMPENER